MEYKKYLFVFSVEAGNGDFRNLDYSINKIFTDSGLNDRLEIKYTEYKEHLFEICKNFAELYGSEGIIYVCGGDGSLHEAINAIYNTKVNLGCIPAGTSNDFVKCKDFAGWDIKNVIYPKISPVDIIDVNGKKSINVTSIGFDTKVLKKAYEIREKFKNLKNSIYTLALFRLLFTKKEIYLEITCKNITGETVKIKGDFLICTICNGSYYGGGFNPSPLGSVKDGLLEICIVEKLSILEILKILPLYKKGKHGSSEKVRIFQVKQGIIKSSEKIIGNMEGEIYTWDSINFSVEEKSVNLAFLNN